MIENNFNRFDEDSYFFEPNYHTGQISLPYDPSKSKIATKPTTVDLLLKRLSEKEIDLGPLFQRQGGLWSSQQKSRLIESLLIRIPLPAFYFDATDDSCWVVVDGLQRLNTFEEFILGDMKLDGLEFLTQYTGKRFSELPRPLRRRIEESQLTIHLIEPGTPSEVKYNIFNRINSGGLILSPQEMRHALNQGPIIKFIENLSSSKTFLLATTNSIPTKRMVNREFILRFLSFTITPYSDYIYGNMDLFLNTQMNKLNQLNEKDYQVLKTNFERAMYASIKIFGENAFRKPTTIYKKAPINKALFEIWSVTLGNLSDEKIHSLIKSKNFLIASFIDLYKNDPDFDRSISQATQHVSKVVKRFSSIETLINIVLKETEHAQ